MAESIKPEANIEPAIPVEAVIDEAVKTVAGTDQTAPAYAVLAEATREVHDLEPETLLLSMVDAIEQNPAVDVADARALRRELWLLRMRRRRPKTVSRLYQRILAAPLPVGEDDYDDFDHGHRYDDD